MGLQKLTMGCGWAHSGKHTDALLRWRHRVLPARCVLTLSSVACRMVVASDLPEVFIESSNWPAGGAREGSSAEEESSEDEGSSEDKGSDGQSPFTNWLFTLESATRAWPVSLTPTQLAVALALLECEAAQGREIQPIAEAALSLGHVELFKAVLATFGHLGVDLHRVHRPYLMARIFEGPLIWLDTPPEVRGRETRANQGHTVGINVTPSHDAAQQCQASSSPTGCPLNAGAVGPGACCPSAALLPAAGGSAGGRLRAHLVDLEWPITHSGCATWHGAAQNSPAALGASL